MSNIIDYLDWRGDISMEIDPFNEVDNLILSELAYTDFADIVPGPMVGESITIQAACQQFFSKYTDEEIMAKASSTKVAPYLMKKMEICNRFKNIRLTGYVNQIDQESQSQFSVITFILEDGTYFVAFRGTDNTIVGWKEDFNMSFLYQTAGQVSAANYINDNFATTNAYLRIGGHSKGGNFSVYASVFCKKEVKNRIIQVYTNDGPGFMKEVTERSEYKEMLPKIVSIIPESSIVGMLLENTLQHKVVKSTQTGAMQHDLMTWEILGNQCVLVENVSESSVMLDSALKKWVYGLNVDERQQFVDTMFQALEATGALTLDELSQSKMQLINEMSKTFIGLPQDKQQAFRDVIVRLVSASSETLATKAHSNSEQFTNYMQEMISKLKKPEVNVRKLKDSREN